MRIARHRPDRCALGWICGGLVGAALVALFTGTVKLGFALIAVAIVMYAGSDGTRGRGAILLVSFLLLSAPVLYAALMQDGAGDAFRNPTQGSRIQPAAPPSAPPPPPATHPSSASPAPASTYEDICGSRPPGRGAPTKQRAQLYALWLGPQGVGATNAGCSGRARKVTPGKGVWFATGQCSGTLVSTAVATEHTSTLLRGNAARFLLERALDGTLRGASGPIELGTGEAYSVDTTRGTNVVVRRNSDSPETPEPSRGYASGCGPLAPQPDYVIVPPELAGLWLQMVRRTGWAWPVHRASATGRLYDFVADGTASRVVGTARCRTDRSCELRFGTMQLQSKRGFTTTLSEVGDSYRSAGP